MHSTSSGNPPGPQAVARAADTPPMSRAWEVVVIGAGPAGTAAACELASDGLQVLLVEAKAFPRRKVCGGCLNQVSTQLVQKFLGAEHHLWHGSLPLHGFQLSQAGRRWCYKLPAGFAVDRQLLDDSLVRRAVELGVTFCDATTAKLLPPDAAHRRVELSQATGTRVIESQVVVLASGLGNRAAGNDSQLQHRVARGSRVGVEAIFAAFPEQYSAGTIHMAVGDSGYVGLTQIAGARLHVAAAVDRPSLQHRGPAQLIQDILKQADVAALPADSTVSWRGTPALTSRAAHLAAHRVFLVGDAAGYVEPFTGEGIRWALESGIGVAPLAARAVSAWNDHLIREWEQWYGTHIAHRQRLCRHVSWGLKYSATRWLAAHALRLRPGLADSVIYHLNTI